MGFLSMFGLVTVEEHNRIVAKQDALIDRAAKEMKGEDFEGVTDHAGRVALIMARLRAARSRIGQQDREIAPLRDRVGELERQLTDAALLAAERAKEIAALKTDAEKHRAKAARDAEIKRAKRAAAKAG